MKSHQKIISEVISGNGKQFSIKEILGAHIRENKSEHRAIFDRLTWGERNMATKVFVYKAFGILFTLLGGLAYIVLIVK